MQAEKRFVYGVEFPTVAEVARELEAAKSWIDPIDTSECEDCDETGLCRRHDAMNEENSIDVRLQVLPGGGWQIRSGDSQYDADGRGWWGCSSIGADDDCVSTAEYLIDDCEGMAWDSPPDISTVLELVEDTVGDAIDLLTVDGPTCLVLADWLEDNVPHLSDCAELIRAHGRKLLAT